MAGVPINDSNLQLLSKETIAQAIHTMNDDHGERKAEAWRFVFGLTQLSMSVIDGEIAEFLGITIPSLQHTTPGNYLQGFYHDAIFYNGNIAFDCPYSRS